MKVNHKKPESDPQSSGNRGLESNRAMTKHGQIGAVRSHIYDPAAGRIAPKIGQALNVTTFNVQILADTTRETDRVVSHGL